MNTQPSTLYMHTLTQYIICLKYTPMHQVTIFRKTYQVQLLVGITDANDLVLCDINSRNVNQIHDYAFTTVWPNSFRIFFFVFLYIRDISVL